MKDRASLRSALFLACLLAGLGSSAGRAQDRLEPMPLPAAPGADSIPSAVSPDVLRFLEANRREERPPPSNGARTAPPSRPPSDRDARVPVEPPPTPASGNALAAVGPSGLAGAADGGRGDPPADQPRRRAEALRRPSAGRRLGPGTNLGRRGRARPRQGALGPRPERRLRLRPARRRGARLQQGDHHLPERQLHLRRGRTLGVRLHDRCDLQPPGLPPPTRRPPLRHPGGEERRVDGDGRRVLRGPPGAGDVRRGAVHRRPGALGGPADRRSEPGPGAAVRGGPGEEHAGGPGAAGGLGAPGLAGGQRRG